MQKVAIRVANSRTICFRGRGRDEGYQIAVSETRNVMVLAKYGGESVDGMMSMVGYAVAGVREAIHRVGKPE